MSSRATSHENIFQSWTWIRVEFRFFRYTSKCKAQSRIWIRVTALKVSMWRRCYWLRHLSVEFMSWTPTTVRGIYVTDMNTWIWSFCHRRERINVEFVSRKIIYECEFYVMHLTPTITRITLQDFVTFVSSWHLATTKSYPEQFQSVSYLWLLQGGLRCILSFRMWHHVDWYIYKTLKQSHYRPGEGQRVPGS